MRASLRALPDAARPVAIAVVVLAATLAFAAAVFGRASYHYHAGRLDAARGRVPEALAHLEAFAAARPLDPLAAEAHVEAGRLYAGLQRCLEARRHFEAAARGFPKLEPWASRARLGLMQCPDYFPLVPGRVWVYGDSASRGAAMRQEWEVRGGGAGTGAIATALFAGNKRLSDGQSRFAVVDWTLWQTDSDGRFPLLEFPYTEGRVWTARRGDRELTYRIDSVNATARTAAGVFTGCLKIRETTKGFKDSWRYDYYCPFVGRALTTVAGPGFENPNTELISYH
jgi:tetratricopeptide (TPR) repeat protein